MTDSSKNSTVNTLRHWYSFRLKLIFEGILIGLITGFVVVLFRIALERIEENTIVLNSFLKNRIWLYPVFFIGLILIGLLTGIKRAGHEHIPKGNTFIYPGDILIIISNEDKVNTVQYLLAEITGIDEIEAHYQYEFSIRRFFRKIKRIFRPGRKDQ